MEGKTELISVFPYLFPVLGLAEMSGESVEVQLARVDERLAMVLAELKDAKDSRKGQYESIEGLRATFASLDKRVENVESKLASAQPTIEEFITIKHKVQGAGAFGKWLWAALGIIIGVTAASRETILHWLTGGR